MNADPRRSGPQPAIRNAKSALWITPGELATVRGTEVDTERKRAERGHYHVHHFPSEKHEGRTEMRIGIAHLEETLQREIEMHRRRFATATPEQCLAEIQEEYGEPAMNAARRRFAAVQAFRNIAIKTTGLEAASLAGKAARVDSAAVEQLCREHNVDSRTLRRWQTAFDAAVSGATALTQAEALHAAFVALVPKKRGRVRALGSDPRQKLQLEDKLVIQGLYMPKGRAKRAKAKVWRMLTDCCIRCKQSAMDPSEAGYRGLLKSHYCPACTFSLSYATVARVIDELSAAAACLGRQGPKAYDDKFARYAERDWEGAAPCDVIFGDHHPCDIQLYDPRKLTVDGKLHFIFHPPLTAFWDVASGVVSALVRRRANSEGINLAFRAFIKEFGVPKMVYVDNGEDYCSAAVRSVCADIGSDLHHTLPSKRGKESHAKSKPIERWFGTFERDFVQELPGWIGHNETERKQREDILLEMEQQHGVWVATQQGRSPFLSVDEFAERVQEWIATYHARPAQRQNRAPLDVHREHAAAIPRVNERALDVLLLERTDRTIRANGVEIDGHTYYSPELFGHEGEKVNVRMDPDDRSKVIVLFRGRVVIAYANLPAGFSKQDIRREKQLKREQRRTTDAYIALRQQLAENYSVTAQVIAERGLEPKPEPKVVNGVELITPAHGLAARINAAERGTRNAERGTKSRVRLFAWEGETDGE